MCAIRSLRQCGCASVGFWSPVPVQGTSHAEESLLIRGEQCGHIGGYLDVDSRANKRCAGSYGISIAATSLSVERRC